jgi:hypothetical protein
MQINLNKTIRETNESLLHENKKEQDINGIGKLKPYNLFLHQDIEKIVIRKKGQNPSLRIRQNVLIDGIHVTEELALKWYRALQFNYMKLCDDIEPILTKKP